jgi:hypothetical protein
VVKRSLLTGALICVFALLGVAAPALSLRPYRPDPVDFSMAPAGSGLMARAAGGGSLTSRPLRAPKRFNLVGLTWRGAKGEPHISVRTRRSGGRWSRWTTLSSEPGDGPDPGRERTRIRSSAPTWTGEADWVQYRLSRRLPGLRLRFVNVRGTATALDRAKNTVRRVASAGVVSLARLVKGPAAHAQGSQPDIVSRREWGAAKCPPRAAPDYGQVRAAFVHHTVNANDYTRDEAPDVVLAICRFHRNSNGWNDIGYNFLVDRFGTIYEGRAGGIDQPVVGAQAQGYNSQSTGIANIGTFTSVEQTAEALRAMAQLIRWKLPLHGVPTTGSTSLISAGGPNNRFPAGRAVRLRRIIGHRDTGATACPGNALYAQLPELRALVGQVQPTGIATSLRGKVATRRATIAFGAVAPVTGRLTVLGGPPPTPLSVEVQALVGSRWRRVSAATTDATGAFTSAVSPRRSRLLRLRFAGLGELRASTSPRFPIAVRPLVAVVGAPSTGAAGRRVRLRGSVAPRKRYVYQVLQQRRRGRYRTVGTRRLRVRGDGSYRGGFAPARAGVYRFYIVAKADRATARAASAKYRVVVRRRSSGGASGP